MTNDTKDKKDNAIAQPVRLGSKMNSFHKQVAEGAQKEAVQATIPTGVNTSGFADMSTVVIFPDCSGSMSEMVHGGHDKSFFCREAVNTFVDNCFLGATKVGLASFPELVVLEPTAILTDVKLAAQAITPTGSTPMHEPLDFVIDEWPITHGIVISDGSPDRATSVIEAAKRYKDKNVKIDAVHIGADIGGEDLMKQLAGITGGIYIKFTDVRAFAEAFKFLTPRHRLTLTTSKNPMLLLGAADVKL